MKTASEIANKFYSDNVEIRNDLELCILRYFEFHRRKWIENLEQNMNEYINAILCTKTMPMPNPDSNSIAESITKFLNNGNN
jgi:hypothetical protein